MVSAPSFSLEKLTAACRELNCSPPTCATGVSMVRLTESHSVPASLTPLLKVYWLPYLSYA